MVVCGFSLHQGSTESRKTLEQKFIVQIGTLNPHGINAFHSTNLFCCFSRYQAPTNSVPPSFCKKPHTTHNSSIRSDEGLTLEKSAFESLYGGQFTLSTQLIKPNYLVILPPTQHYSFFRNLPPLFVHTTVPVFFVTGDMFSCFLRYFPSVPLLPKTPGRPSTDVVISQEQK